LGGADSGVINNSINAFLVGALGGEELHTLSVAEMPNHAHGVNDQSHDHSEPLGFASLFPGSSTVA
jgi:microcystin-dependent protein